MDSGTGRHRLGARHATHLLALEPRMMFDAAAVATTEAVMAHADAAGAPDAHPHDTTLDAFAPDARTAAPADTAPSRAIIFIDTAVADYRQLAAEWSDRGEVVLIDATADGVEQMRMALSGRSDLGAIHIVGHGEAGRLSLGTARLDADTIAGAYAGALAQIGGTLAPAGDILIYGCNFAAGSAGARAVGLLADVTHADIAASTDVTGTATRGGDWTLETSRGAIEARTLAALDWAHTLDPNVAVPISVGADSLTVTFDGATVVTGATGYGGDNRSPDVGVGAVARWAGAATLADGTSVDLKATVVSLSAGDAIRFNRPGIGANGDDPTFLLRDISTNSATANDGGQVEIRWELVRSGTDTPLAANVQFNILDIDGVGGRANSRETVSTSTDNLAYYTRARASDIAFTSSLDRIAASGTQNENTDTAAPVSEQSAATFDWTEVSSFTLTYQLAANNGVTNLAQFYHDGDADFIYTDPVYVSIPRLDLDGNDSTAPGNDAAFTFREGDAPIAVVDGDVVVTNPMGPGSIIGGTVTLTNAKPGDALIAGTLPAGISQTTRTNGDGSITVTLTGAGSEADYAAAFRAIGFANASDTPDPTQRVIEVSFSNDQLTSAIATSRITVVPVNDAPIARPDTATTPEDTATTIIVLGNDSDADGDTLTVTGASADNGTVVVNGDGTLGYTPNVNFNGTDTIRYTITDGNGGTADSIVTVTVTPVNDAPTPVGTLPARTALDRDTVSYATAGGFTDADGDALTYAATGLPAGLTMNAATGVISGTLDRSASRTNGGSYTITVTARDPSNATTTQTFTVTVANPVPVARNDTATTPEDSAVTIAVLANDSDPDGDPLTVTGAAADNGAVIVNPDGTLTYTPNADFNGTDTIRYTISDNEGGTAAAIVTVTVTPVNDAPRAAVPLAPQTGADAASISFATAYAFTDPDGDTLAYAAAGLPPGLAIDAATGLVSGTLGRSASQPNGGRYTVTVTATDPGGAATMQSFAFTATNPAPIARADSVTTPEDTAVTVAVLANDSDPDGDPLTVTGAVADNGAVIVNPDGTLTYTPNADFNGTDTIRYTITDGEGGTATSIVTVTVTPVNDPPRPVGTLPPRASVDAAAVSIPTAGAFADADGDTLRYAATGLPAGLTIDPATGIISGTLDRSASQTRGGAYAIGVTATDPSGARATQGFTLTVANPGPVATDDTATTPENIAVAIAPLGNDSDPDGDPLTVTRATAANGSVAINPDGTLTYTPQLGFRGTDRIDYTIDDGQGGTAAAIVTVTVTGENGAPQPIGTSPSQSAPDAGAVSIGTAGGFGDPDGDTLTYAATGLPAGLAIDRATGIISGTLDRSASQTNGGVYTVAVTATDPFGASATQSFTLTAANPPPVATDDRATTSEDTPVTIAVLANDADPDGDPLTIIGATADTGAVIVNADGTLTFTPARDFTGTATVRYTISDGQGGTAAAIVTVTVTPANDAPRAAPFPAAYAARDGETLSLPLAGAFTDPDGDALRYGATGLPAGLTIDAASGIVSGTIDRSASQPNDGSYTVTLTATDPAGATGTRTIILSVANPAPTAEDDVATTPENLPVTISVLTNDTDPDADPLTVIAATAPNGSVAVNPDGTLAYTPNRGFIGTDTIRYTIGDGEGGTAAATVTVTVGDIPPVAQPIADQAARDEQAIMLATAPAFSDANGDTLTYTATGLPQGLTIDPVTGTISGTLDRSASQPNGGAYATIVTADDGNGGTAATTIRWTITNPAPVAQDDAASTRPGVAVTIPVLANDADPDGDPLTVIAATAANGSVTIDPDGTLTYTSASGFAGTDTIRYTIDDGEGGTAAAIVTVDVANFAPVARPDEASTRPGTPVTIPVLANDSDADGDPLTIVAATAGNGSVAVNPDGTLTYTPNATFSGPDMIAYTISDGRGGAASATVAVGVVAPDRAPVAQPVPDQAARDGQGIALSAPFSDPDGDPLTYVATDLPPGLSIDPASGVIAGTIARSASQTNGGRYATTVTASDGRGGTATTVIRWTIADPAPVAQDDTATTRPGVAVTIPVLANDADPDGDPLTVVAATAGNGSVTINPDGTLTYTPAPGFAGTDTIRYTIDDGEGGTAAALVTVGVTGGNRAPLAGPVLPRSDVDGAALTAAFDGAFGDPDGDALTYAATGLPPGLSIDPATGLVAGRITPGSATGGQAGDGRFAVTITARDPSGATASVTFVWTVGNAAPIAQNDIANVRSGASVIVPVLANDRDPEGDPLTVVAATAAQGRVTINADGTIAYAPTAGFVGTDTIAYTVSDGRGGIATAIVTVGVSSVDGPPVVPSRDRPIPAIGGQPLAIDALAGVIDPDGDPLTLVSATAGVGTVTVRPDGTVLYVPPLGFAGPTTISFTVSDGRGGFATGQIPVQVADGRGADVRQLLRFGRPQLVDPTPGFATVRLTPGEIRNPLIVIETVNAVRTLRGTDLGDRPVSDAVNGVRSLRGTDIAVGAPVTQEIARLQALTDFRDAGDRLFDTRWGDFMVRGLTGSSIAADRNAGVMVESVVRGHAIYVEVRDIAGAGHAAIRSVDVRPAQHGARGHARPEWLHVDRRGLAVIERGAGMDELHLIVRVTRTDGRVTATPIVIEGETGVVSLDRPQPHASPGHARPLDATLSTPSAAAAAEAARLSQLFQ